MTPAELRAFVLALPGTTEGQHQGRVDFRVKGKIAVNLDEDTRTVTIKLSLDEQQALVARGDGVFSLPGGWAKHGWTTIDLATVERAELEELVADACAG